MYWGAEFYIKCDYCGTSIALKSKTIRMCSTSGSTCFNAFTICLQFPHPPSVQHLNGATTITKAHVNSYFECNERLLLQSYCLPYLFAIDSCPFLMDMEVGAVNSLWMKGTNIDGGSTRVRKPFEFTDGCYD